MLRELTHTGVFWTFTLGTSKTVWVKSRIPQITKPDLGPNIHNPKAQQKTQQCKKKQNAKGLTKQRERESEVLLFSSQILIYSLYYEISSISLR